MIKLTVGEISSQGLQMALQKISGSQVSVKTAYRFKKMNDAIQIVLNKMRTEYKEAITSKFAVLDDKGGLVPDKTPWGFKLKDGTVVSEFEAANDEFNKREVTIDRLPLSVIDLNELKISAAELSALGVFLIDPETVADSPEATVTQIRR